MGPFVFVAEKPDSGFGTKKRALLVSVIVRNNVKSRGTGERAMVFAHGFGCDQNMWRFVAPAFEKDFRTILFDHVGHGRSDLTAYNSEKYGTLTGYAQDLMNMGAS